LAAGYTESPHDASITDTLIEVGVGDRWLARGGHILDLADLHPALQDLRAADLPRLRASGPLGELLARQGEAHGEDHGMAELGYASRRLPDDLLNFQYDPVAAGWNGTVVEEQRLWPVMEGDVLRFQPDQDGRLVRVVVDLDGASFTDAWLTAVEAAQQGPSRRESF
jgi:hypothetical protein